MLFSVVLMVVLGRTYILVASTIEANVAALADNLPSMILATPLISCTCASGALRHGVQCHHVCS